VAYNKIYFADSVRRSEWMGAGSCKEEGGRREEEMVKGREGRIYKTAKGRRR
jgi:hypothetical protein